MWFKPISGFKHNFDLFLVNHYLKTSIQIWIVCPLALVSSIQYPDIWIIHLFTFHQVYGCQMLNLELCSIIMNLGRNCDLSQQHALQLVMSPVIFILSQFSLIWLTYLPSITNLSIFYLYFSHYLGYRILSIHIQIKMTSFVRLYFGLPILDMESQMTIYVTNFCGVLTCKSSMTC